MTYKLWTTTELKRIDPALSIKQNAARLGRSPHSVMRAAAAHGIKTAKWARPMSVRQEAIRRYRNGTSARSIAADVGVSPATVHSWIKRHGA